jgi:hypothetical protein
MIRLSRRLRELCRSRARSADPVAGRLEGRVVHIGITGHVLLGHGTAELVDRALREVLAPWAGPGLVGVTCLAPGSDQIFARVVLELGGRLEVVLPAPDYREKKIEAEGLAEFDRLLRAASRVSFTGHRSSGLRAYLAASKAVITRSARLLAVWDGSTDQRPGATHRAVAHAHSVGVPVDVIWPAGALRR